MTVAAMCPLCGKDVPYSQEKYGGTWDTFPNSVICDECENDDDLMSWHEKKKQQKAEEFSVWYKRESEKPCPHGDTYATCHAQCRYELRDKAYARA